MWALKKQCGSGVVGIVGLVGCVKDVFGGAIAMEEVFIATDDEGSLRAENAATRAAVVRYQTLLVAIAQRHIANLDARSK